MNGVHDIGGMHGFGPIEREENEPLFHADWERRALGIAILVPTLGYYNDDADRYGWERMAPAEYLQASYYELWLTTVEYNLARLGILTGDELATRIAFFREHPGVDPPPVRAAAPPPLPEAPMDPPVPRLAPRFAVGDVVLTRNVHPVGHTRLPRYARGKRGVIQVIHSPQTFPDTNAHGLGKNPQIVYNVRFEGRELWGDSAEPHQVLYLDLWDSYLVPAPA
jgi:nitrile hydratase subunit beta